MNEKEAKQTKEFLMRNAARTALTVQGACNLRAVINSMHAAKDTISRECPGKGTDWINRHPILQMYASKIHNLSGMGLSDVMAFERAYALCERMADGDIDCY